MISLVSSHLISWSDLVSFDLISSELSALWLVAATANLVANRSARRPGAFSSDEIRSHEMRLNWQLRWAIWTLFKTVSVCNSRQWSAGADPYRAAGEPSSTYSPQTQVFYHLRSAVWRQQWRHRLPAWVTPPTWRQVGGASSWLIRRGWSEGLPLVGLCKLLPIFNIFTCIFSPPWNSRFCVDFSVYRKISIKFCHDFFAVLSADFFSESRGRFRETFTARRIYAAAQRSIAYMLWQGMMFAL